MAQQQKNARRMEFGDFQTPLPLARAICTLLARQGCHPKGVIEPTCGSGNFLLAALEFFPLAQQFLGVDINPGHIQFLQAVLKDRPDRAKIHLTIDNFFEHNWSAEIARLPEPLLVLGNPPWVTNAALGSLGSQNLPKKSNIKNLNGLDALTGKSNFDISEWMLLQILRWLHGREATLAMLCKTSVARKVLLEAWKGKLAIKKAEIRSIDSATAFQAAVEACLLLCHFQPESSSQEAACFSRIHDAEPTQFLGIRNGRLIANLPDFDRWAHLAGNFGIKWRSGIKHDCAKIMELQREGNCYRNGLQELWELETDCLYPLLKSSDLAHSRTKIPRKYLLVPQRFIGENTLSLRDRAPQTWKYLQAHAEYFNRRASSIYKDRPPFSIFGVGDYSFTPGKVGVSALYKKLAFVPIGTYMDKPIILDDTCYFLPCTSLDQAEFLAHLLNSPAAKEFLNSLIFWDAKRPITIEILQYLDLLALAHELKEKTIYFDCLEKFFPRQNADLQQRFSFHSF